MRAHVLFSLALASMSAATGMSVLAPAPWLTWGVTGAHLAALCFLVALRAEMNDAFTARVLGLDVLVRGDSPLRVGRVVRGNTFLSRAHFVTEVPPDSSGTAH